MKYIILLLCITTSLQAQNNAFQPETEKDKKELLSLNTVFGVGTRILNGKARIEDYSLSYDNDLSSNANLDFTLAGPAKKRPVAVTAVLASEYVFWERLILRIDASFMFGNDHYADWSIGLGYQQKFPGKVSTYLRAYLLYDYMNYGICMGRIENDSLDMRIKKKTLKGKKIDIYLGNRTHSIRPMLNFSVEVVKNLQIMVEGFYQIHPGKLPQTRMYAKQKSGFPLFRKQGSLPVDDPTVDLRFEGAPTTNFDIMGNWGIRIGVIRTPKPMSERLANPPNIFGGNK